MSSPPASGPFREKGENSALRPKYRFFCTLATVVRGGPGSFRRFRKTAVMKAKGTGEGRDGLDREELQDARRRAAPKAAVVYEAIRQEGEEELERRNAALVWSGLAAGMSMGFSFLMEALLSLHIPNTAWKTLVSKFGYCIGFIIVVLGRQQLFTENTLTPILQLLHRRNRYTFLQVVRLWLSVLVANLAGAALFALLMLVMSHYHMDLRAELIGIGIKTYDAGFPDTLLSGVFAGWLIALMVWLLPFAETGRVMIIILITYVIGLGGFAHIIAGSVNAVYILLTGDAAAAAFFTRFFIPALLGNILGGVGFVAALNHAQVRPDRERSTRGSHP
jgi:formate/nitrite transporter FocA (FNT family)